MERFSFIFLVAGLGFFALAFVVSAWVPMLEFDELEVDSIADLAKNPPLEFIELREQYSDAFKAAFGEVSDSAAFEEALKVGHKIYIGEACWHCHSQQVRPVGGDEARFGRISYPEEYNNDLNYPPIWGTRRVGPDLVREAGRHSNDWHVAHFFHPPDVSPTSVMPSYTWFYEADGKTPNKKGLSIIAYVQWLGSWQTTRQETIHAAGSIDRAYAAPKQHEPKADTPQTTPQVTPDDPFGDSKPKDDPFGETKPKEEDPFK